MSCAVFDRTYSAISVGHAAVRHMWLSGLSETAKVVPADVSGSGFFGGSVALSGDGRRMASFAVTGYGSANEAGKVYVFELRGECGGVLWCQCVRSVIVSCALCGASVGGRALEWEGFSFCAVRV